MRRFAHHRPTSSSLRACACAAVCVAAAVSVTGRSAAQPASTSPTRPVGPRFESGVRLGYAVPIGKASGSDQDALSDTYGGQFVTTVEAGFRTSAAAFAGLHATIGMGGVGGRFSERCAGDGQRCWANTYRMGLEAIWHLDPSTPHHAWVGYGLGYEWARARGVVDGRPVSVEHRGLEFARLMIGMEFSLGRVFRVGPFLDVSAAQYAHAKFDVPWTEEIGPAASKRGIHMWMAAGAKLSIGP